MQHQINPVRVRVLRAAAAIVTIIGLLGVLVGYPLVLIGVLGPGAAGPTFRGPILEGGLVIGVAGALFMISGSVIWRRLRAR